MTLVESDVTRKSLAAIEAPPGARRKVSHVQPRHKGAANAYFILTGGGPDAWIKHERNLRMYAMIMQVAMFLGTLVIKELIHQWASRQLERS